MNTLQFAGDVVIEKLVITTSAGKYQDITNQVIGIQIFEDIFSPFITGSIVIKDSLDLVNMFPLIGEERLDMKISTPTLTTGNMDYKFAVTKMTNRTMIGDRSVGYELHFISIESVVDVNAKISKTYSGNCSDIVKSLLTDSMFGLESEKTHIVEETSNRTKYTSNYWSVIKNINFMADTAVNKNYSPSFVFFENRNGFNFVSLETLYENDIYQEFVYDNYIRDVKSNGNSSRNVIEDYRRIRSIKIPVSFDYIKRNREGLYGSRMYTYDITTKRAADITYNMFDNYASEKHLNDNPVVSTKATYAYNSNILNIPKCADSYTNYGDVTNTKTIQKRLSLMAQINSNKIEITVPGRCDYTVGMKVKLKLNKIEPIKSEDSDIEDKLLSGNYIVSAINHVIDRITHECNIELVKESLIMNLY